MFPKVLHLSENPVQWTVIHSAQKNTLKKVGEAHVTEKVLEGGRQERWGKGGDWRREVSLWFTADRTHTGKTRLEPEALEGEELDRLIKTSIRASL